MLCSMGSQRLGHDGATELNCHQARRETLKKKKKKRPESVSFFLFFSSLEPHVAMGTSAGFSWSNWEQYLLELIV